MGRAALWRWLWLWIVVSFTPALAARAARAAPCDVGRLQLAGVPGAIVRWRAPPLDPRPPRWTALLPATVQVRFRDASNDGVGWYANPGTETWSQRGLVGMQRGWTVAARWDLRPLFRPAPQRSSAQLKVAALLAERLQRQVVTAAEARRLAADEESQSPGCAALQARMRGAQLVVDALTGRREVLTPAPRRAARPVPRLAVLPRPDRGRRR